ncbi:MAG: phosphoribosyltransferase [Propionibacteriaceae bacterium]|jgi:predicted amidophosphoribosyltransferase|nr:phosphoribosyltransferase [Propionibacteriaceae bacterium]
MTPLFGDEAFRREHGSYLCNVKPGLPPAHGRPGTCQVCAGPVNVTFTICRQCEGVRAAAAHDGRPFPIDYLAFLTYAVEGADLASQTALGQVRETHEREGRQAYLVLKGYKSAASSSDPLWMTAVAWTAWFLQRWGPWAAWPSRRDDREWCWATVPSVRSGRQGEHPFHAIVAAVLGSHREVELRAAAGGGRGFNPNLFSCGRVPDNAPVLLVDDSWTSGGNLLSAAATLKEAGASSVNAMVLGRLLNPGAWPPTREFIDHDGLRLDFGDGWRPGFDPRRWPWTKVA